MKLNEKTLLFVLVVLLILISIYHNKKLVYSNNNKFLLLGIIIALFVFYHKFTNGRIEKFYNDQYKNYKNKNKQIDGFTSDSNYVSVLGAGVDLSTFNGSGGSVSVNSVFGNSDIDRAFNGTTGSYTRTLVMDPPNTITIDYGIGNTKNIKKFLIWSRNDAKNENPRFITLTGSNDVNFTTSTQLYTNVGGTAIEQADYPNTTEDMVCATNKDKAITTYLTTTGDFRFYKFVFIGQNIGGNLRVGIGELALYEEISNPSSNDNIDQTVQDAFNQIDTNNDGKIDFNEFKLFIQSSGEDLTDEDITDAFNIYDTDNDNHINLEEFNLIMLIGDMGTVLDTEPSSTAQYLKRLFLNKSEYHNSSPTINMLNSEQSRTPEIGSETDNDSELRKTQLNFYNFMNGTTGTAGNNQSIKDILSGDTSVNDLLQYNYADVDDLLADVSGRNYNFNISPVNFNIPIVNGDPNSTETGTPNPDDNSGNGNNGNNDEDNSEQNLNNVVNDITQEPEDETNENVFSSVTYDRRITEDVDEENTEENTDEDTDDEEDTQENTQNNQDRQSIYNTLFGDVQQDEERDGISYYVNRFFSSVQDLFD